MPAPRSPRARTSKLLILIVLVLVGFSAYLYQELALIRQTMGNMAQSIGSLVDENSNRLPVGEQLVAFGQDLNEIRRFLYLPTKQYTLSDNRNTNTSSLVEGEVEDSVGTQLFQLVDKLDEKNSRVNKLQASKALFETAFTQENIVTALNPKKAQVQPLIESENEYLREIKYGEISLFTAVLVKNNGHYFLKDSRGNHEFSSDEEFMTGLQRYVSVLDSLIEFTVKQEEMKKQIIAFIATPGIAKTLSEKNLAFTYPDFKNKEGTIILKVFVDPEKNLFGLDLNNQKQLFPDPAAWQQGLTSTLLSLDTATGIEKLVKQNVDEIMAVLQTEPFQDVLREKQLSISSSPVYETDRVYFHFSDKNGVRVASIAIERGSGEVKVVDGQGLNPASFEDFLSGGDEKKKL